MCNRGHRQWQAPQSLSPSVAAVQLSTLFQCVNRGRRLVYNLPGRAMVVPLEERTMSISMAQPIAVPTTTSTRWIQLVLGWVAMMSISSPQYVWTLFTKSFQESIGTTLRSEEH